MGNDIIQKKPKEVLIKGLIIVVDGFIDTQNQMVEDGYLKENEKLDCSDIIGCIENIKLLAFDVFIVKGLDKIQ